MFKKLFRKILESTGNTLYYPGCLCKFAAPELIDNYRQILKNTGLEFIELDEFNCCGSPALNAGYEKDFLDLVKKNKELFKRYGIKKIISNCPSCVYIFKTQYDMNAKHVTEYLAEKMDKIESKYDSEPISYHDPCHLGRKLGIYKEPRQVLEKLGFELVEFDNSKEKSGCCGAGGGVKSNFKKLANKAGKLRIKECKTKKMVTTCPLCYKHLKENSKEVQVLELSEVLI